MDRHETLGRLAAETYDIVVIGAGIIGARVAYEAAQAGAKVALLDARDFGSATSSASSKLIHGGLRYLPMGDIGLIRQAHAERRLLLDRIAPHLVHPLAFVLPIYRGGPHNPLLVGAAMLSYSALSGFRHSKSRLVGPAEARHLVPPLRTEGLRSCGIFLDAQTNDARLVLATVMGAARAGAVVLNHCRVTGLELTAGKGGTVLAGELRIGCRAVVNATGPWVDAVRRLEDPAAAPISRLSKGAHVLVDQAPGWRAALATPVDRGRVAFAVPWEGMLLLGTTDTEFEGDPGLVAPDADDVKTVLHEASLALPPELIAPEKVRYTFAGLRVLPRGPGDTAAAPRDHVIHQGPGGMVSVAGGKLTTHRRIAHEVLKRVDGFARSRPSRQPLPGAGPIPPRPNAVEPATWEHLVHVYGAGAAAVGSAGDTAPVHPHGPDVWAQVTWAAENEWAATVEDVVRRRTTLAVRGLATNAVRENVAATLAGRGVLLSRDGD